MKVGILTFHEADNYGAVLQAFALQQILKKLGAESEFVCVETEEVHAPETASGPAALFMKRIKEEGAKRALLFKQFRESNMICSPRYKKEELENIDEQYDLFIAGSDQIWNFRIPGADERYFLPFADPKKRFSYAASFGSDELPEKAKPWCSKQLERFVRISVREESGVRIVKDLTGRDAVVSLDPTLLLTKEEWERMISHDKSEERYMLLFMLKYDEELTLRAKKASEAAGVTLKVITAAFMPQFGFAPWSGVGVNDWISLIAGAEGVFTNSFHGTVFSLLFGRPLSVSRLNGELSKRNGRIEELLKRVGLLSCFDGKLCSIEIGTFEEKIQGSREDSMKFLKDILNNAKTV